MFPATYRKVVAVRHNRIFREAVEIQEVPFPAPGPDEVIIRNLYAGVNAADSMMAAGQYLVPTPLPCDMGGEAIGAVVQVGEDVTALRPGDYVLTNAIGAGYCEYYRGKARFAVPVPAATPEIMSLSVGGLTASLGLQTGDMQSGETVLVTAAAGGTGQFVVQLAKLAGNHVIGTCGSDDKAAYLRSLGCDRVVNYRTESLKDVLKNEYPRGVDLVFEGVGGQMFDITLRALARFGRLVTIGAVSEYKDGPEIVSDARIYYRLLARNLSVRGFNLNLYFGRPEAASHLKKLVDLLDQGKLNPGIDPTVFSGVESVVDAVEYLHNGLNTGKVVVRYDSNAPI